MERRLENHILCNTLKSSHLNVNVGSQSQTKERSSMVEYYQLPLPSRIPKSIVITVLLLIIVAIVAILFSYFLPQGPAGSLTALFLFGILTLISYIVARSKGLQDPRSLKQKQVTTLLCFGFASFFGYAALTVVLLGHPFYFPSNLPLLLVVILAAVLTALTADKVSKMLDLY